MPASEGAAVRPVPRAGPALEGARSVSSAQRFHGACCLRIHHAGSVYTLRRSRNGKLIPDNARHGPQ